MNKQEVYNWIIKVLMSCKTKQQLLNAGKLIPLYFNLHNNIIHYNLLTKKYLKLLNSY